ncbi:OTU domain-containing protein 5-A-like [Hibiscus syriacus]|uniref:OTU domain-containing protein 5-A-like n=1 Tax=Hibiscus syriacus TaxID=106335 RepID=UPI0019247EE6|nr:OTU domain-containing protein 5-A-like [Hibiscus syriacus]
MEANSFSISIESGGKHEIQVVKKRGGGAAAGARGGGGGGDNGSGSGGQIPVYTAGAMNNNRVLRRNGSNSGTILSLTVLAQVAWL